MSLQGTFGCLARTSGLTLDAASPMISIERISASAKTRSRSRSPRWRPVPNSVASRAASSMWRRRTLSLSDILNPRSLQDILSKVPAEFIRSSQIDLAADHCGELTLHRRQSEITNTAIRFEFHEDVDVARVRKAIGEHRAKKREPPDAVAPAEFGDLRLRRLAAYQRRQLPLERTQAASSALVTACATTASPIRPRQWSATA